MNQPEHGLTARGRWYLKPLTKSSKANMKDLGYLSDTPVIMETDIGTEDELYLVSADTVSRARKSPSNIFFRAYWQSSPAAKLIHRPKFSRRKGKR